MPSPPNWLLWMTVVGLGLHSIGHGIDRFIDLMTRRERERAAKLAIRSLREQRR